MSKQGALAAMHLALFVIALGYVFPFIWMIGSALKTPREFFTQGLNPLPAGDLQWANFERAWVQANFSQYFLNTLFIAVTSALICMLLASMIAFALARLDVPRKNFFLGIIGLTMLLPSGYTIIPTFEIIMKLGLLNTLWAVILVLVNGSMMFSAFFLYGYMRTIPYELEEAAILDGASIPPRFFIIALPLSRPMLGTLGLFLFLKGWNEFFLSLVFTLGNPDLRTLAVGMYSFIGMNSRDWTLIAAGATISLVPVIILFILMQRQFVEAFAGAVKS